MTVDWNALEAIATAGGTFITGIALLLTYRLLKIESAARKLHESEAERDRLDREQAQARLISAWSDGVQGRGDHGRVATTFHVRNLSDEPVAAVTLIGLFEVDVDAEGTPRLRERVLEALDLLPPRETLDLQMQVEGVTDAGSDGSVPQVRVEFTDSRGLKWARWPDNKIDRLRSE